MAVLRLGEMRDGSGGSLPDRTMPMSSSCVCAVANGELLSAHCPKEQKLTLGHTFQTPNNPATKCPISYRNGSRPRSLAACKVVSGISDEQKMATHSHIGGCKGAACHVLAETKVAQLDKLAGKEHILGLQVAMKDLRVRIPVRGCAIDYATIHFASLCGPVAVIERKSNLQKDIPDLLLVHAGIVALRSADERPQVTGCTVL